MAARHRHENERDRYWKVVAKYPEENREPTEPLGLAEPRAQRRLGHLHSFWRTFSYSGGPQRVGDNGR